MSRKMKSIAIITAVAAVLAVGGVALRRKRDRNFAEEAKREHDAAAELVVLPSIIVKNTEGNTEIAYIDNSEHRDVFFSTITPSEKDERPDVLFPTVTLSGKQEHQEALSPTIEPHEDGLGGILLPSVTPMPTESLLTVTPGAGASTVVVTPKDSDDREPDGSKTENDSILCEMSRLYAVNPDIAGWIRIAGTEIDYPFAAIGDSANKYLTTSFDGKTKSKFGTIFTRNDVSDPESIPNLVLYGHNMAATGYGMFTQLLKYKNEAFAEEHPILELIVGDTVLVYEFFCCYNIKTSDSFLYEQMSFVGPKDLTRYSEEILRRSIVKANGATAGAARYVTLSTCDRKYDREQGRFAVVFVRR